MIHRRHAICGLASAVLLPRDAVAVPKRYGLDLSKSRVEFQFRLNGISQTGTIPVDHAQVTIDPDNLSKSQVDVTMDVAKARTGLVFITQVMTGPDVLDAAQFPTIRFVSRRIILGSAGRISEGAQIVGDLTLHGVTRPITLQAAVYRPRGTSADDLSQLDVTLRGSLNRRAFGASGYPDLVDDIVSLDIQARIEAA